MSKHVVRYRMQICAHINRDFHMSVCTVIILKHLVPFENVIPVEAPWIQDWKGPQTPHPPYCEQNLRRTCFVLWDNIEQRVTGNKRQK